MYLIKRYETVGQAKLNPRSFGMFWFLDVFDTRPDITFSVGQCRFPYPLALNSAGCVSLEVIAIDMDAVVVRASQNTRYPALLIEKRHARFVPDIPWPEDIATKAIDVSEPAYQTMLMEAFAFETWQKNTQAGRFDLFCERHPNWGYVAMCCLVPVELAYRTLERIAALFDSRRQPRSFNR